MIPVNGLLFFALAALVLVISRVALFFSKNATWLRVQKWFMAGVLGYLAVKMALSKQK